jgi:hypothetical protein
MVDEDTPDVGPGKSETNAGAPETEPSGSSETLRSGRMLQFWLFCALLGLALVGMALTQATKGGGTRYWLIVLWVYALFGLARGWLQARRHNVSIWREISLNLLHWLGALTALYIVFGLEHYEILNRDAASDVSLIILALSSYLAGLHFDRMFILLGVLLAIMAVVGAFVEQYTLWLVVIPTALLAAVLFLKIRNLHAKN